MRKIAYGIVCGTLEDDGHSDELFHRCLERHGDLSPQQKNFVKYLAYGTIERCIELDTLLDRYASVKVRRMERPVRTALRMALYEILHMERVPDAASCNEAVELVKDMGCGKYAPFVNGILRTMVREKDSLTLREDWQRLSLPCDLMEHLTAGYGKKTARKMGAAFLGRRGETTLHIRTDRIPWSEYAGHLTESGIPFRRGYYMEEALILEKVSDIRTLPGYGEGLFFVQDESSMLPVQCAGIRPDDMVIDICSAPGGKAMHALMKLGEGGRLVARDISEPKVDRIRENAGRMGFANISVEVWDAARPDPRYREKADVVLADVPCSGIGIIGRKPEIKYHALERAGEMVPLQREICRASSALVKPGGTFVYSTCTVNGAENEENVRWMERELGLQCEGLDQYLPESLCNKMTERGMLQMIPGIQESDGFFVARLRKT